MSAVDRDPRSTDKEVVSTPVLPGSALNGSIRGYLAAQGLHGFLAAQGLHGFLAAQGLSSNFLAAQGLHGLQGLHGFLAAQGLQGLQAASCVEVSAACATALGSGPAVASATAALRATRVSFSRGRTVLIRSSFSDLG